MRDFIIRVSAPLGDISGAQAMQVALDAIGKATGTVVTGSLQAEQAVGRFVDSTGRLREANGRFVETGNSAQQAGKRIGEATSGLAGFGNVIKDIGHFGLGALEEGIAEIPAKFQEAMRSGIEYLAEMDSRTISLAATIRTVEPVKFPSFAAARTEAAQTVDLLKGKANELGVEVGSLVEAYSANFHALVEAGINEPAKQITLISTLMQAEMGKGVHGAQALRDSIDILNGRIGQVVVAKEIGIDEKDLKAAAAAGQEYTYIMSKLSGQLEAAGAQSESFTNESQALKNEWAALEAELAKPTFDKLLALMQGGKGALGSPEATGIATGIGNAIGGSLDALEGYAKGIEGFWDRHPWLKKLGDTSNLFTVEGLAFKPFKDNIDAAIKTDQVTVQDKQFKEISDKVANAHDDNSKAAARKELEEAIAVATEREAKARGAAKDDAKQYVDILTVLRDPSYYGTAPIDTTAADAKAKREADALAKLAASPESRLADARLSGNQEGADDAQYDIDVDKLKPKIAKEYPDLTPDEVQANAEKQVDSSEAQKQREEDQREKERADEKAKRDADNAAKKAAQDAKAAADEKQRAKEAVADANAQSAILEARARGENNVADALEKQRDLRQEIKRLQDAGVSAPEAQATAERNINAANAEQDLKDFNRQAERNNRGSGRGDGSFVTHGYSDPVHDAPGEMHTGHLQTQTLDGTPSTDRFAGQFDDAAAHLDNAPSAAEVLANAPSYVPSFPTATAALAPALAGNGGDRPDDVPPTDDGNPPGGGGDGAASSLSGAASSANGVKSALDSTGSGIQSAAQALAQSLGTLSSSLNGLDLAATLSNLQSQVDALQGTVSNLNAGG